MDGVGERIAAVPHARLLRIAALGATGAVYAAYAVCWAFGVLRDGTAPEGALPALLYGAGEILAVLAAPAWFATCVVLPRTAAQRLVWLVVGLIVLVPLPLVLGTR